MLIMLAMCLQLTYGKGFKYSDLFGIISYVIALPQIDRKNKQHFPCSSLMLMHITF